MRLLFRFLGSGAFVLSLGLLIGCEKHQKPAAAVPTVLVSEVEVRDVPIIRSWVGLIDGAQNADIEARVSGYLLSQNYTEGSLVQAGQVLFQIDPRPYQAALAEAEAQLAAATAKAQLARITLERQTELFKTKVISAQEFDVAQQTAEADIAAVQAAEANAETARLNLEFCTVIAPFQGIAGKAQAQVGDLVGPGAGSVLTTVSQIQPIKVSFFLSEQDYLQAKVKLSELEAEPFERRPRTISIVLANGETYSQTGVFDFLNRQVDPRTGTIQVFTLFPNPEYILRPGQFANVKVAVHNLENAIVIPQRAVNELQGTLYQVAVLNADNTVDIRNVTVGFRSGSDWVISEGLAPGDKVVVEGAQKLRNGMKVTPKPFVPAPTPTPSPTPTPEPIPTPGPSVTPIAVEDHDAANPTPAPSAPAPTATES